MTAAVQAMLEQARALTTEERAELIEGLQLLEDVPPLPEAELWATWRPELDRRWAAYERGELQTVDAREAIQAMRERLRSGTK